MSISLVFPVLLRNHPLLCLKFSADKLPNLFCLAHLTHSFLLILLVLAFAHGELGLSAIDVLSGNSGDLILLQLLMANLLLDVDI